MENNKCTYIKEDGERCDAIPMGGSDFCFSHNPDTKIEKYLAVVKGGLKSKKVNLDLEPLSVEDPKEVAILLESTINGVRSGKIPPNIANTIGYLAGHALKAIELARYGDKIESVERVLMERKIVK